MITAIHTLVYSDNPAATRTFFKEVLRWPFVSEVARGDEGIGGAGTSDDATQWLIFRAGPSELGVHPTSGEHEGGEWRTPRHHSISVICDDLDATMVELTSRGAEFAGDAQEMGFGRVVSLRVPGADDLLLYQPHHPTAYDLM